MVGLRQNRRKHNKVTHEDRRTISHRRRGTIFDMHVDSLFHPVGVAFDVVAVERRAVMSASPRGKCGGGGRSTVTTWQAQFPQNQSGWVVEGVSGRLTEPSPNHPPLPVPGSSLMRMLAYFTTPRNVRNSENLMKPTGNNVCDCDTSRLLLITGALTELTPLSLDGKFIWTLQKKKKKGEKSGK